MIEYLHAHGNEQYAAAAILFREYSEWLGIDLGFQKFEKELGTLQQMYALPQGGIILVKENGSFIACAGIRKIDAATAELKRMYIKSSHRGRGIGKQLLAEAIDLAKQCGYKKIKLDTLSSMQPAMQLYRSAGFKEIPAYYHNPNATAVFFEKEL